MRLLFLLSLVTLVVGSNLFGAPVIQLNDRSFRHEVLYNGNVTAVVFYAPWCGHCQNLASDWTEAARKLKGITRFAAVDCDFPANKDLCARYGVQGFPTIKVFQPAKLTDVDFKDASEGQPLKRRRPKVFSYKGNRDAKSITSFVVSKLRNYAATLDNEDSLLWMAPNLVPRVVMLPGKKYKARTVSPLLKVLSREYFGKIRFAVIPRRVDGAWNLLGLDAPDESQLVYLSDDKSPVVYKGSMKKKAVKQFIDEQYQLEMSRRKHFGVSEAPDRSDAAHGLEFVTEDAQEGVMQHVEDRKSLISQREKEAEEARIAAFERQGKVAPPRPRRETTSTTTTVAAAASARADPDDDDVGADAEDFDEAEASADAGKDSGASTVEEDDSVEEEAAIDEALAELRPDQVLHEGPEAVASYLAAHQVDTQTATRTKGAKAPRATVRADVGIVNYDMFVLKCLRSGMHCAIMITTADTQKTDLLPLLRAFPNLNEKTKQATVFEYIVAGNNTELDGFLQAIGAESFPKMLWVDGERHKGAFLEEGVSTGTVTKFIVAGHQRKLDLSVELPPKYLFWLTALEVEAEEAARESNSDVKDEL